MRDANPRIRFVLVGDGPLRPALEAAHGEVLFTGFIPQDQLARHYASADIYVHASLTETYGNVLAEAMASGLAVVAFDYASARHLVRHGENGLAVPVGESAAFVDAAVELARDAALRARLRAAAPLTGQTWDAIILRFEADLLTMAASAP
jgi:glycosyltransferase involved in cell wall biosynthesis